MDRRARDGGRARRNLGLRPARGLAQVLVGDQRNQKHQAHIAERIQDALALPLDGSARASPMLSPTHGGPSVSADLSA